jgi:hypothetical protein
MSIEHGAWFHSVPIEELILAGEHQHPPIHLPPLYLHLAIKVVARYCCFHWRSSQRDLSMERIQPVPGAIPVGWLVEFLFLVIFSLPRH